jgi:hypothetical protein
VLRNQTREDRSVRSVYCHCVVEAYRDRDSVKRGINKPQKAPKKFDRKQNGIKGTLASKKRGGKAKRYFVSAHGLLYLIPYGYFQTLLDWSKDRRAQIEPVLPGQEGFPVRVKNFLFSYLHPSSFRIAYFVTRHSRTQLASANCNLTLGIWSRVFLRYCRIFPSSL